MKVLASNQQNRLVSDSLADGTRVLCWDSVVTGIKKYSFWDFLNNVLYLLSAPSVQTDQGRLREQ